MLTFEPSSNNSILSFEPSSNDSITISNVSIPGYENWVDSLYPPQKDKEQDKAKDKPLSEETAAANEEILKSIVDAFCAVRVIDQSGDVTIITFEDGEVVHVKRGFGEVGDDYSAFCAAMVKRLFGSTSRAKKILRTHTREYLNNVKKAEREKKQNEQAEKERTAHQRRIRRLAKSLRDQEEAARLNAHGTF